MKLLGCSHEQLDVLILRAYAREILLETERKQVDLDEFSRVERGTDRPARRGAK